MSEPCRKPNLVDGMISIAALAAGLGLGRAAIVEDRLRRPLPPSLRLVQTLLAVHSYALACVLMLTLAWLIIRLRRPRPKLRDLAFQPGMVACSFAAFASAVELCVMVFMTPARPARLSSYFPFFAMMGAFGVITGWSSLALVGRWRPERGWIDRLGWLLGLCWLGLTVFLFLGLLF